MLHILLKTIEDADTKKIIMWNNCCLEKLPHLISRKARKARKAREACEEKREEIIAFKNSLLSKIAVLSGIFVAFA